MKKYNFDETFFSNDTPESFYWAGFIAADGCIKERGNGTCLTIALSYADKRHLQKFKKIIKFSGPISKGKHTDKKRKKVYYESRINITITKTKAIEDLKKFNIIPRKSLIYTFPKWLIKHKLVSHFMRGYFDGDGSFSIVKQKGKRDKKLTISIRGTEEFLNNFNNILIDRCSITDNRKVHKYDSIGSLSYVGNKICTKVRDFLYKNSNNNIRLSRKYKLSHLKYFMNIPENCNYKPAKCIEICSGIEYKFNSIKDGAKFFNIRRQNISSCLSGRKPYLCGLIWDYGDKI